MAVYNTPSRYLDEAVASILGQSYTDFEFIIIDDGSDQVTRDYLRVQVARDSRVRLHCLPSNIGLTRALNVGLGLARGAYIARQDADDISDPARFSDTIRFLEANPEIAAAGTRVRLIGSNGQPIGEMVIDSLERMARRNFLVHGSMTFRKSVFDKTGGYDERMRLSQDYELYLRMQRQHGLRLGVVPAVCYSLRQHSGSLSNRRPFRQLYYSVLAKSLTLPGNVGTVRRTFFFLTEFLYDLVITHRLLLGQFLRRYFIVHARTQSKK